MLEIISVYSEITLKDLTAAARGALEGCFDGSAS